jgi:DNA-binding CsgD family transcriptional regulator
MLLVLDNCEHLIGACAVLAGTLLPSCPDLHVLATSREALGIAGERVWLVPSRARFAEMMEDAVLERNPWTAPFLLMAYAHLAAGEGQATRALRLAGTAEALQQTVGTSMGPAYQAYLRRDLARARRSLSEEEGAAALEAGRAMTLEEAIAHALEEPAMPREEQDAHHPPTTEGASTIEAEVHPEPYPDGLTAREAEVLGMLAGGKTNKQIAAELVLSVSTVQRHVANVCQDRGARACRGGGLRPEEGPHSTAPGRRSQ